MPSHCKDVKSGANREAERIRMVETQLRNRGVHDERVLKAMQNVPRHLFLPEDKRPLAYTDGPVQIGHGQTLSQPYMVALMSQCLRLRGHEKVLEIGTGSGYQSAILLELADELYTIERIGVLAERAEGILRVLGYSRFHLRIADGTAGWPESAPFDAIMVTAGAPHIPETLLAQLTEGGRLVLPVGSRFSQTLETC
ncbi:MAG: protein-L-isoaspartate O-methyltransferase, partial [Deltaproteobacteria bacterium]|nr:protein-L-isoaspartate O-methyltransferase [Deltaproteobacteria bacterium]